MACHLFSTKPSSDLMLVCCSGSPVTKYSWILIRIKKKFQENRFVNIICQMVASLVLSILTHWGRVTHICVSDLTIIGSDNGLSPGRRQAIIWTNAGLLSIELLRTYFSENLIKIQPFSLKKMHVKMSSAKWRPSCLGLNVLKKAVLLRFPIQLSLLALWGRATYICITKLGHHWFR